MELKDINADLTKILVTQEEIHVRIEEIAREVERDYAGQDLLLIGVLKGAVMVMADFSRALLKHVTMDWMAVSSYGDSTRSSGVVRILKDLDTDIAGKNVLIVEDIIDTGLTLSWLSENLKSRNPASLAIFSLFRKPEMLKVECEVRYVGFDIANEFIVGYGLDYAEEYRNIKGVGVLDPHVYAPKS